MGTVEGLFQQYLRAHRTPELCLAALVLGAQDLLVAGDHLAIVHIHDFGADLAVGGGHWGMRERRR